MGVPGQPILDIDELYEIASCQKTEGVSSSMVHLLIIADTMGCWSGLVPARWVSASLYRHSTLTLSACQHIRWHSLYGSCALPHVPLTLIVNRPQVVDWFQTFSLEVCVDRSAWSIRATDALLKRRFMWTAPWSIVKVLFFLNRYNIVDIVLSFIRTFFTPFRTRDRTSHWRNQTPEEHQYRRQGSWIHLHVYFSLLFQQCKMVFYGASSQLNER